MNFPNAELIVPRAEFQSEFQAMAEEFSRAAEGADGRFDLARESFADYLEKLAKYARDENLPPGRVPQSTFWLIDDKRLVGESRLRHYLNDELEDKGGHIGYSIRPSARRRGFGTLLLKLTLAEAKNLGLQRVLLTCDADNTASAKIIEKNGGVLDSRGICRKTGKIFSRYWITMRRNESYESEL